MINNLFYFLCKKVYKIFNFQFLFYFFYSFFSLSFFIFFFIFKFIIFASSSLSFRKSLLNSFISSFSHFNINEIKILFHPHPVLFFYPIFLIYFDIFVHFFKIQFILIFPLMIIFIFHLLLFPWIIPILFHLDPRVCIIYRKYHFHLSFLNIPWAVYIFLRGQPLSPFHIILYH